MEILAPASQHQHRHWQRHCKKIIFAIRIFFFKVEYLCSFLCLVMVSVALCYKYLVLYDFLFIQSKASIGVLEKSYLNIRKHPSWCFKKTCLIDVYLHAIVILQGYLFLRNASQSTTKATGCEVLLYVILYSATSRIISYKKQVGFELA